LEEDLFVRDQIVTADGIWKMGTYAFRLQRIATKSSKLLNPSVFKYILKFRAASGLALALTIFFNVYTYDKELKGILKVIDSFFGGII
jgi:hypothetical protein